MPRTIDPGRGLRARIARLAGRLRRDRRGAMSIEAVLWLPLFAFFILLVVDVSTIYLKQSEAMRAIHEGNRALSVGRLTPVAAQDAIAAKLLAISSGATVSTSVTGSTINSTATLPIADLTMSRALPLPSGARITLNAQQMVEY